MIYSLIININSGSGNNRKKFLEVKKYFPEKDQLKIHETVSVREMHKLLDKEINESDVLIFAGGDGTIREALAYCYYNSYEKAIGIIPSGSGNDLVRSLNIKNDLKSCIETILIGQTTTVYPVKLNDSIYFNVASIGLDAEIVAQQKKYKKIVNGPLSYVAGAIEKIATFKADDLELYIDGQKSERTYAMVVMASGSYYGGGMNIAPQSSLHNKKINVVCLAEKNKLKIFSYLPKMMKGNHLSLAGVDHFFCDELVVKSKSKIKINLDGDLSSGNYIKVRKLTGRGLKVFVPDSSLKSK